MSRLALLTSSRRPAEAARLYAMVARAYPSSSSAEAGLSDALAAAGRTSEAKAAAEHALGLLDADASISDAQKQSIRRRLSARVTR
jgi:hypothetical protein